MKKSSFLLAILCMLMCQCNQQDGKQQTAKQSTVDSLQLLVDTLRGQLAAYNLNDGHLSALPVDTIVVKPPTLPADWIKVMLKQGIGINTNMIFDKVDQAITKSDETIAREGIIWAWGNTGPCTQELLCKTYVGNFFIVFKGSVWPFKDMILRWFNSAHDCIQNAINALKGSPGHKADDVQIPDRALAVAWVMASQIHNKSYYEWLRTHGDAVVNVLLSFRHEVGQ